MITFQRQAALKSTLDIAPLIDIIFLLLLFFILTSVFAEPGIPVDLAESARAELQQEEASARVSLLKNGDIRLNGAHITLGELPRALTAVFQDSSQRAIAVDVDEAASFERFVELIDIAKAAGGQELLISTELPH